jgi:hypothetical protein
MSTSSANAAVPSTRRKMVKPKMDFAKALSIMGFSTSRTLDPSGGHDARVELNAALSKKMLDIEKRKRAANKKEQTKIEDKLRDEIRTLHEAYQFLCRKYIRLQEFKRRQDEAAAEEENEDNDKRTSNKNKQKPKMSKQTTFDFDDYNDDDYEEEGFGFYGEEEDDDSSPSLKTPKEVTKSDKKVKLKTPTTSVSELPPDAAKPPEPLKPKPQVKSKPAKIAYTKLKKVQREKLNSINEEETDVGRPAEQEDGLDEDASDDDDVFDGPLNEEEASLCQLINSTFKMVDDDDG